MRLAALVRPELIFTDVPGSDRATVLRALSERVAAASTIKEADELYRRLSEREELGCTGIGPGVAVPHCKLNELEQGVVAIGLSLNGVDFDTTDGEPVRVFFVLVSPSDSAAKHLQSLAAISSWVKSTENLDKLLSLRDPQSIYELLASETE